MALKLCPAQLLWYLLAFLMTTSTCSDLHTGLGMVSETKKDAHIIEPKKRSGESEADRQMVTIDLSALRPSLPGLVLYNYGGEQAPKLVQIDLSSLNPLLQPHVIWPQFDQMDLGDPRPFELDSADAIPYLSEKTSLLSPRPQRFARFSGAVQPDWSDMDDLTDNDVYDFMPDSLRNEELMTLHRSLPLADEVIVPLDWEEKSNAESAAKRNVFMSKGWTPGGQKEKESKTQISDKLFQVTKGRSSQDNVMYTPFGLNSWRPGKRLPPGRETETEGNLIETPDANLIAQPGKKNVFISKGWGPGGRSLSTSNMRGSSNPQRGSKARGRHGRNVNPQSAKISSQESWSVPRRYWTVPHLFGVHFQ